MLRSIPAKKKPVKTFAEVKASYDQAVKRQVINVFLFSQMITAAGKHGSIDLAIDAYQRALEARCANVVTYNSMINAAGKCGRIDLAIDAYQRALDANCADVVTYNSMIDAAGKCNRIDLAEKAYQRALEAKCADVVTYSSMIDAAGKCNRIDLAENAYQRALEARCADVVTYSSMIDAAGKCGRIDLAIDAYQRALDANCADVVTYNSMISAAGKCNRIDLATEAYQRALGAQCSDMLTHSNMISALVQNKCLSEAQTIYNLFGRPLIIKRDRYDLHDLSYGEAYVGLNQLLLSTSVSQEFCIITGKGLHSHHFDTLHHPVKQALIDLANQWGASCRLRQDPANEGIMYLSYQPQAVVSVTTAGMFPPAHSPSPSKPAFNIMIDAAGKCGRIDLAIDAYQRALDANCADVVTFNSMINAAGKCGRIDLATEVYQRALGAQCSDMLTHSNMISILVQNKCLSEAQTIYHLFGRPLSIKKDGFDLYDLNYGEAYLGLNQLLLSTSVSQEFCIITGRGLHSHNFDTSHHPVKQALIDLANQWGASCQLREDPANEGVMYLSYQPQAVVSVTTAGMFPPEYSPFRSKPAFNFNAAAPAFNPGIN